MKPVQDMTEAELAAFVSEHLRKHGIRVVLCGGACVTIYGGNAYVSGDLDLVSETFASGRDVEEALGEIGFVRAARVFRHPCCSLAVDIRPPPLAVGQEPVREIEEMRLSTGTLRLVSPTDCVKDRLAGYYYHGDRQCLEQARLVAAHSDRVDLAEVERWSRKEGQGGKFSAIKSLLQEPRAPLAP